MAIYHPLVFAVPPWYTCPADVNTRPTVRSSGTDRSAVSSPPGTPARRPEAETLRAGGAPVRALVGRGIVEDRQTDGIKVDDQNRCGACGSCWPGWVGAGVAASHAARHYPRAGPAGTADTRGAAVVQGRRHRLFVVTRRNVGRSAHHFERSPGWGRGHRLSAPFPVRDAFPHRLWRVYLLGSAASAIQPSVRHLEGEQAGGARVRPAAVVGRSALSPDSFPRSHGHCRPLSLPSAVAAHFRRRSGPTPGGFPSSDRDAGARPEKSHDETTQ